MEITIVLIIFLIIIIIFIVYGVTGGEDMKYQKNVALSNNNFRLSYFAQEQQQNR